MKVITKFRFLPTVIFASGLAVGLSLFASQPASAADSGHQFVADVNGDGHADAITVDIRTGDWWAAMSNGTNGFQTPSRWITGFGVRTSKQFVEDVTGDGKADVVTFDRTTGDWWAATSSGSTFSAPSRWIKGHGYGSANQLMGDINGDGKSDAVIYWGVIPNVCSPQPVYICTASWWGATANVGGTAFDAPGPWFLTSHGAGSTRQFLADVTGDDKADAIVWSSVTGDWWVSNSDGVHFNHPNRWIVGHGVGSSDQFLADVTGDGKADAIVTEGNVSLTGGCWGNGVCDSQIHVSKYGGPVYVAASNAAGFDYPSNWLQNFGFGITSFMFGDVFATPNEDLVSFAPSIGDWWVLPASDKFDVGVSWISGFGVGTN